jgi:hypothetical protein
MTDILDGVKAALAQMTPGPWCCGRENEHSSEIELPDGCVLFDALTGVHADVVGACVVVNSAPALVAEVERLKDKCIMAEGLEAALEIARDDQSVAMRLLGAEREAHATTKAEVDRLTEECERRAREAGLRTRELQQERKAHAATKAELAALKAQTCETCVEQRKAEFSNSPWCAQATTKSRGKYPVQCRDMGNGCRAWQKREA